MGRPLTPDEMAFFKTKFGYAPAQVDVAQDAVGIYVHKDNPLAGLTLVQFDGIYSRDAKRGGQRAEFWRDLGRTTKRSASRHWRRAGRQVAMTRREGRHPVDRGLGFMPGPLRLSTTTSS